MGIGGDGGALAVMFGGTDARALYHYRYFICDAG
jgi:hypothetical protein